MFPIEISMTIHGPGEFGEPAVSIRKKSGSSNDVAQQLQ
jgi:hypothetical protein